MSDVELELYQAEERKMAVAGARKGLWPHALVTIIVSLALAIVNVFVAPEFPWAVFPFLGMTIGLLCHWYFGVRRGEEFTRRHQQEVERELERHRMAA